MAHSRRKQLPQIPEVVHTDGVASDLGNHASPTSEDNESIGPSSEDQ